MERIMVYATKEQKLWLVNNSITPMASKWGHEGRTQSEHIREALNKYIEDMEVVEQNE